MNETFPVLPVFSRCSSATTIALVSYTLSKATPSLNLMELSAFLISKDTGADSKPVYLAVPTTLAFT